MKTQLSKPSSAKTTYTEEWREDGAGEAAKGDKAKMAMARRLRGDRAQPKIDRRESLQEPGGMSQIGFTNCC